MNTEKSLNVQNIADAKAKVSGIEVIGNGDLWQLLCKASSKSQGWMKSTKAMQVVDNNGFVQGCLVQVTTQQGENIAEAIEWVPNVQVVDDINGGRKLASSFVLK
jgi:PHP family Zn ribbon phosphoesterase